MSPNRRSRATLLAALSGVALLALTACGGATSTPDAPSSPASPAGPSAEAASPAVAPSASPDAPSASPTASTPQGPAASPDAPVAEPAVSGSEIGSHIHNLAYDGRDLMIGTHEGLWGHASGADPAQVSKESFDVMGLAVTPDRWFASGHPGPGMDAPEHLGLLASDDRGRTWTEVALGGDVDFHRLVTSGDVIVGINSVDGALLRSEDGGDSWESLGQPGLYDVVIDPSDPSVLVGTSEDGPVRSTDGGATFSPIDGTSLLALAAWTGPDLYAVDVDGRVHHSADGGLTWTERGALPGQPIALAADGLAVAALVDDAIWESVDGGTEFAPRITDLGGH